eukprot:1895867-Heterocapsa_arctica.AAC.1
MRKSAARVRTRAAKVPAANAGEGRCASWRRERLWGACHGSGLHAETRLLKRRRPQPPRGPSRGS